MGNNDAFTAFEHTVIVLCNHGKLSAKLLDELAELHRGTDIDPGGTRNLKNSAGMDLYEIILAAKDPGKYAELKAIYQRLQQERPGVEEPQYDDLFDAEYYEPRFEAVHAIMAEWGWR